MKKFFIALFLLIAGSFCFAKEYSYKVNIGECFVNQKYESDNTTTEFFLSEIKPIDKENYEIHITATVHEGLIVYTIPMVYIFKKNDFFKIYFFVDPVYEIPIKITEIQNNYMILSN